jgi:hypothetical protein
MMSRKGLTEVEGEGGHLDIRVILGLSLDHVEVPNSFVELGNNFLNLLVKHPSDASASNNPCIGRHA